MSLECGIVGLPNVGKSTLFNTLTSAQVAAENFPFCTVDPNRGVVDVPDPRMDQLIQIVNPKSVVRANMTFVDIAGLVKGASAGEGLGNQFLSHIREVDAITHVVRCFEDDNITHVMGGVDPVRDVEIIDLELCLSDMETASKRIDRLQKVAKSGNKDSKTQLETFEKIRQKLGEGIPVRRFRDEFPEMDLREFLTSKPIIYLANVAEAEAGKLTEKTMLQIRKLEEIAARDQAIVVPMSNSLEFQLSQLSGEDREMFFQEYGIKEPGLNKFIHEAYRLLGLITYFTAGEKEVRAWTVHDGATAVEAAGKIHSDFAKGFIRAEVIHFGDFIECKGEKGAREKGLQRSEGRDYRVLDGDIILFRFNV